MPSSASPYVVLLGVSPGNSPRSEDRESLRRCPTTSEPPTFGCPAGGFSYRDPRHYWEKASTLCQFLVRRDDPRLSETDALAVSGHLNLGIGLEGKAGEGAIEDGIVRWVSRLLNSVFEARVLVGFGLNGLLAKPRVNELWNCAGGLPVDWRACPIIRKFDGNYSFRLWTPQRANGERMAVLLWPNHPSRPPFAGRPDNASWQQAKQAADEMLREHDF